MQDQKKLTLEVISTSGIKSNKPKEASGWGDDAQKIELEGEVAFLTISKNGKPMFGLRILPDGSVTLASYNVVFSQYVENNLRLTNERSWNSEG